MCFSPLEGFLLQWSWVLTWICNPCSIITSIQNICIIVLVFFFPIFSLLITHTPCPSRWPTEPGIDPCLFPWRGRCLIIELSVDWHNSVALWLMFTFIYFWDYMCLSIRKLYNSTWFSVQTVPIIGMQYQMIHGWRFHLHLINWNIRTLWLVAN